MLAGNHRPVCWKLFDIRGPSVSQVTRDTRGSQEQQSIGPTGLSRLLCCNTASQEQNETWAGFLVEVLTGLLEGVTPRRARIKRAQTNLAESGCKLIAGSSQPDCSMPDSEPGALLGCMSAGVGPAVVLGRRARARADAQQPRLQLLVQRPHQRGLERALDHLQRVHAQLRNSISRCLRPSKTGSLSCSWLGCVSIHEPLTGVVHEML